MARCVMTVSDLITKLSSYPADAHVTLLYPDRRWLLPIEITHLSADGFDREVDFIAITADNASDEIEGLATRRPSNDGYLGTISRDEDGHS